MGPGRASGRGLLRAGLRAEPLVLVDTGHDGWYAELDTGATTLAIADIKEAERLMANVGIRRLDPAGPANPFQISFITSDVPAAVAAAVCAGETPG